MKEKDFIKSLIQDHKERFSRGPLKKVASLKKFLSLVILLVMAILIFLNWRQPIKFGLNSLLHWIEWIFLFLSSFFFLLFCYYSRIPGKEIKPFLFGFLTSILVYLVLAFFDSPVDLYLNEKNHRYFCYGEGFVITGLLTIILHGTFFKSEFLKRGMRFYFILLGLPVISLYLFYSTCSSEFFHGILYHFLIPLIFPLIYLLWRKLSKK